MKRFVSIAAVALLFSGTAFTQKAPAPTGVNMLNFQRAVSQNDEGAKAYELYQAEGKKLSDDLLAAQKKVSDLQDKLAKGGTTISDADKNALMREIEKEKQIFDLNSKEAQSKMDDKQAELFRPVAERVKKVVEAYAKEQNLAVVVDDSDDLVYASDVVDITTEIIRKVNADIVKNPAKSQ